MTSNVKFVDFKRIRAAKELAKAAKISVRKDPAQQRRAVAEVLCEIRHQLHMLEGEQDG